MDLYSKIILELNNNPPNYAEREDAQHEVRAHNTYCGDKYMVLLDYSNVAGQISFTGHGCAVSKASIAIMTDCVHDKSWQEIHDICAQVLNFLNGSDPDIRDIDARLESFAVVRKYPGRYDCAALCWKEMRDYCIQELKASD